MDYDLVYHNVIRQSDDRGLSWRTILDDVGSEGLGAYGYGLQSHPAGAVIEVGWEWTRFGFVFRTRGLKYPDRK